MKSPNIISTTGRIPVIAPPTPRPVMPASEIGESITRPGPNSSTNPASTLNGVPASATSSPIMNTVGSRRISSASASRMACASVISRVLAGPLAAGAWADTSAVGAINRPRPAPVGPPWDPATGAKASPLGLLSVDIFGHLSRLWIWRIQRKLLASLNFGSYTLLYFFKYPRVNPLFFQQPPAQQGQRIAIRPPILLLLFRAIIRARNIAHVVTIIAIGIAGQESRSLAAPGSFNQLLCRRVNLPHILPIHFHSQDAESPCPRANITRHPLRKVRVFPIHVVLAHVDHRQFP